MRATCAAPLILLYLITWIIFGEKKLDIIADHFCGLPPGLADKGWGSTSCWGMTANFHIHPNSFFLSTLNYIAQCDWNHFLSLCWNLLFVQLTIVLCTVTHSVLQMCLVGTYIRKKSYENCRSKFTIVFPGVSFSLKSLLLESWRWRFPQLL